MISRYQTGETKRVARGALVGAPYNPRTISRASKARLRKSLKHHGLIAGQIVWNERTGNVVAGHQRLGELDALEGGSEYELDVTAIDVDELREKQLNAILNNPALQGEYDMAKLGEILSADLGSLEAYGYDALDAQTFWPDDERFGELYAKEPEPTGPIERDLAEIEEIKRVKREARAAMKSRDEETYYVTIVAHSGDEIGELLTELGIDLDSRYVSCSTLLAVLRMGHSASR